MADQPVAKKRILLAIENRSLRSLLQRVLQRCGFEVAAVDSGAAAVEHLAGMGVVVSHLSDRENALLAKQLRDGVRHLVMENDATPELDSILKFINQQN